MVFMSFFISESLSTQLRLFALSWQFPESLRYQILGPSKLFSMAFIIQMAILAHVSDFSEISQTRILCPQCALCLSLSGPRPGSSSSLDSFGVPPSPAQVAATCRLFCSLSWVALDRTKAMAYPGLRIWEMPEAAHLVDNFGPHQSTTQPPPK